MNLFHAIILSIIEGVTEFLPISSTGHLILTAKLLNIPQSEFLTTFEITIQIGAILAIVTLYSKTLLTRSNLVKKVMVAFIPTAAFGFILYPLVKNILLGNSAITLWALFLGGIALIIIEKMLAKRTASLVVTDDFKEPTFRQAFAIGVFQSASIVPGVSRAAATIMGGLMAGLNRQSATEFSFLLAVPTMLAAAGLDIWQSRHLITSGWMLTLFFGTVLSFFFALFAVKFLVNFVKNHDFTIFGVYRIILAILFWLFVM